MSCEISVIYPGLEGEEIRLEIPETSRAFGIVSFGSDPTVCFGSAPGMGGFVLDRWEAEEYGILPRHCALLWAGGKFRLEFDRHAGVYLNGSDTSARSFCNPFEDGPEFEMRLGLPSTSSNGTNLGLAPVFRIRRTDRARRKSGWLSALATRFKWFRKAAMIPFLVSLPALVVAVTVMGLAFAGWNMWQGQRITEALIRGDISTAIGARFEPSVASIGVACGENDFTPYGTAWLYEHKRANSAETTKWLVTNLHVVRQMAQNQCNGNDAVRQPLAKFPDANDGATEALEVLLPATAHKHPLHDPFEIYRSQFEISQSGQQAVANLYDLAAFKLGGDAINQLGKKREFLKLHQDSPGEASSFAIDVHFTQNIEPGRPVLILSYPTENQPFLADGVSSEPFQFRTTLQSKSNAMSRGLPGDSSNRTPALYSFTAKSAGGMSGSPVIAVDQAGDPFISGVVFAASFVRGASDSSSGLPRRLASGDGTYALDATSLAAIQEWPIESETVDRARTEEIELVWNGWSEGQKPVDEKRQQFADLSDDAALKVCSASRRVPLNKRLREEGAPRGETGRALDFEFLDIAKNTLIVAETRSTRDQDTLLQLAICTTRNNRKQTSQAVGLNQATFLKRGSAPLDVEISVAGPHKSQVVLTAYEAVPVGTDCPTRKDWK